MRRWNQAILICSTILGSWLGMQAVHESGHVLGAWITGGRVAGVVLNPLTISRTDLADNPRPLFVVWSGPIVGIAAPLVFWAIAFFLRSPAAFLFRFFAGFCLLANGLYIGCGSFGRVGDCGDMLRNGSALWQLWLFAAVTAPCGMWIWHGLGKHFGFGPDRKPISRNIAYGSLVISVTLLMLGFLVGGT